MPTSAAGTSSNTRPGGQHGFTLMELVVVIAVLALAAAIVLPRLTVSRAVELKRSARALAATIRYLQDRAITSKTPYRMRIEIGTGTVRVTKLSAAGTEVATGEPALDRPPLAEGVTVADVLTQRGGKLAEGEAVLRFDLGGLDDFAAIHLKSADGATVTVMALPSSGKVTVADGYLEEPR
ncbi:prepilin-type N-terminal cleavage/methylation domain-containing protein [Geobacter sp.]|uniref:prepilin-type N-terminal cleavage/methylation domain-containing protein n=1 Tax=Geobacter sp. TaxID=46610 RepID=UPI0026118019|nr:prepilin-type N-terminal cleavage/methylation domain-containing protein [Geobacter sp.]